MAFGITNRFKGGKPEHYDAVVAKVHPPGGLPEGQTYHFAGETDDGFIVVAIWDSEESWKRFRDEVLIPGLQEAGDDGFPEPPEETTFVVHNAQQA
jgi:hypothetical protein